MPGVFGRSAAFSIYDQGDVARVVRDLFGDDHARTDESTGELAEAPQQIALANSASPHRPGYVRTQSTQTARGSPRRGSALTPSSNAQRV
jgi:hypothetical protein